MATYRDTPLAKLDIRHLQMLIAIEASASLSAAAVRLNITPSALSHRMREAERRMHRFLFHRKANSVRLTPAGRRLLTTATSIIDILDRAEKESSLMEGGYETVVRISSRANLANAWLGKFCHVLQNSHPETALEIVSDATAAQPLEQMRTGIVDLILLTGGWDLSDLTAHKLFEDELVGLVSVHHEHANRPFLTGTDFMNHVLVAYSFSIEPNLEYDLMFSKYEGLPRRIMSVGTADAVLDFVARGLGMGVLPRAAVNENRYPGEVKLIPLTERGLFTAWYCAHLPVATEHPFISVVKLLADWCKTHFCLPPPSTSS